ncbi:hypothetical protein D9M68_884740 [compost metagenome]
MRFMMPSAALEALLKRAPQTLKDVRSILSFSFQALTACNCRLVYSRSPFAFRIRLARFRWSFSCTLLSASSRATSASTPAFSITIGLPDASALTSAKDSACIVTSSTVRAVPLFSITCAMNPAFRSSVCQEYASKVPSVT